MTYWRDSSKEIESWNLKGKSKNPGSRNSVECLAICKRCVTGYQHSSIIRGALQTTHTLILVVLVFSLPRFAINNANAKFGYRLKKKKRLSKSAFYWFLPLASRSQQAACTADFPLDSTKSITRQHPQISPWINYSLTADSGGTLFHERRPIKTRGIDRLVKVHINAAPEVSACWVMAMNKTYKSKNTVSKRTLRMRKSS